MANTEINPFAYDTAPSTEPYIDPSIEQYLPISTSPFPTMVGLPYVNSPVFNFFSIILYLNIFLDYLYCVSVKM